MVMMKGRPNSRKGCFFSLERYKAGRKPVGAVGDVDFADDEGTYAREGKTELNGDIFVLFSINSRL